MTEHGRPMEEWHIPSSADPQARLFVRARGPRGKTPALLVHGFFQPASAILDVPGYSLQVALAEAGLRVYLFDFRGYGRSSRPAFMDAPADDSRPALGCMDDALADLHDAVGFVQDREDAAQVDLVGYSWGTARSARFALQAPARVRRLALYAPVWRPNTGAAGEAHDPRQPNRMNPRLGGYALTRPGDLQRNWDWEIDRADWRDFRSVNVLEAAEHALMASDTAACGPGFRAPLGPMVDAFGVSQGGSLFDARSLGHDVIMLRGAQDRLSSETDAANLFAAVGSPNKRLTTVGNGTHLLHLEHARWQLVDELVSFLAGVTRVVSPM